MNTIKFSLADDIRTETHNVEIYDEKFLAINGTKRAVDSHCSIMIYPSTKCNAKCSFCMNNFDENIKSCIDIKDDSKYFSKLKESFEMLKHLNPTFQICGGEPTISHRMVPILKLVNEYGLKNRSFPTNGTGLLNTIENKLLLQHMLENNVINNINLSRMSCDDTKNKELMGINLTNKKIKTIATFCDVNNMSFRTSCVLMQNGIETLGDLLAYQKFYSDLNISSAIFREMIKVSGDYKNDNFISILDIMKTIENDTQFEFIRCLDGAYYSVDVYKYNNYIVKCYKEKFKEEQDLIRDFVFMPNGNLYIARWNKPNELLI